MGDIVVAKTSGAQARFKAVFRKPTEEEEKVRVFVPGGTAMDDDGLVSGLNELRREITRLGELLVATMAPAEERPYLRYGEKQLFNLRHVIRAEFSKTGDMQGTVKIWFTADAGLGGKPLVVKGRDGDFIWAYLGCSAEDLEKQFILS